MAIHCQIMAAAIFFTLALSRVHLSTGQLLRGSVSCLDCDKDFDLSGIKVVVKCKQVKKLGVTITNKDGSFKAEVPKDISASKAPASSNCLTSILGGPKQLYTPNKNMVTNVVKANDPRSSYTISRPLSFYKSCPLSQNDEKCGATNSLIYSSKTIDLPLPKEWGLAPSSYYVPFIPIIGIP